jgi:hypothetical protein
MQPSYCFSVPGIQGILLPSSSQPILRSGMSPTRLNLGFIFLLLRPSGSLQSDWSPSSSIMQSSGRSDQRVRDAPGATASLQTDLAKKLATQPIRVLASHAPPVQCADSGAGPSAPGQAEVEAVAKKIEKAEKKIDEAEKKLNILRRDNPSIRQDDPSITALEQKLGGLEAQLGALLQERERLLQRQEGAMPLCACRRSSIALHSPADLPALMCACIMLLPPHQIGHPFVHAACTTILH